MGLRIELEEIWKRLQTRFKARRKTDTDPEDPEHPVLMETIQPVTQIDELLADWDINIAAIARLHASGTGYETICTVPKGKRWKVRAITIARATGDMTVGNILMENDAGDELRVWSQTTAAALNTLMIEQDIVLDEGWLLKVQCTAVAADSTWNAMVYRAEEDTF